MRINLFGRRGACFFFTHFRVDLSLGLPWSFQIARVGTAFGACVGPVGVTFALGRYKADSGASWI